MDYEEELLDKDVNTPFHFLYIIGVRSIYIPHFENVDK